MRSALLSLYILFIGMTVNLYSQTVTIALDEASPPFTYRIEKTGEAGGLYPRLLKELFNKIGVSVDIKPLPWKRALHYGNSGEMGVMGIYRTDARDLIYDYSDPIVIEKISLMTLSSNRESPRSLEDLRGKTLGVLLGWSYGQDFEDARSAGIFSVIDKRDDSANLELLGSGRVDYILILSEIGETLMDQNGNRGRFRIINPPLMENKTYLGFNKNMNKKALLLRLNESIRKMKNDGTYSSLIHTLLSEEVAAR